MPAGGSSPDLTPAEVARCELHCVGQFHTSNGISNEVACRYILRYTYELSGEDARAVAEYNEAIEVLPGSVYAQAAQAALDRRKKKLSAE